MKTLKEIRLKNLLIANEALETETQKLTNLKEIRLLKNLLKANEILKTEIRKLTNELVLSRVLCFSKTPRNYNEILEILKNSLGQTKFRWINLMFYARYPADGVSPHPHIKIKIFLFGKRTFILKHIREISERIVNGKRWMGKEAGISSQQEFCIKDFI